jgi:acetylornithine/succinyldiaminopimelate/putrescine aminotransferase
MERYARERLITGPVHGLRGRGLLLGLETTPPARELAGFLFDRGILTGTSSDTHVLRLMPPLTVTESEIERLGEALELFAKEHA